MQVIRAMPNPPMAGARFDLNAPDTGSSSTCERQTFGDCVLTSCPVVSETNPPVDPNAPMPMFLEAGTITVSADQEEFSANGTPSAAGSTYVFQSTGSLTGGGVLTINATGGTVSAFTGTIPFPLAPLLLAPSIDGMKGTVDIAVPRNADFSIRWDARDASEVIQTVVSKPASETTRTPNLSCSFTAAAGMGTLPSTALAQLSAGTRIRLFGVNSRTIEATPRGVALLAAFQLISSDKASYPTFVLQ